MHSSWGIWKHIGSLVAIALVSGCAALTQRSEPVSFTSTTPAPPTPYALQPSPQLSTPAPTTGSGDVGTTAVMVPPASPDASSSTTSTTFGSTRVTSNITPGSIKPGKITPGSVVPGRIIPNGQGQPPTIISPKITAPQITPAQIKPTVVRTKQETRITLAADVLFDFDHRRCAPMLRWLSIKPCRVTPKQVR